MVTKAPKDSLPAGARIASVMSMTSAPGAEQHPERYGDTVIASVDYVVSDNIEALRLVDLAIQGTGNAHDNDIVGNAQDNILSGLDGNDRLDGDSGDDDLLGGYGDDELHGSTGNDRIIGGEGNDRYVFSSDDGHDVIDNLDADGWDELELRVYDNEIVRFRRDGDSLDVLVGEGQDRITGEGWYAEPAKRLDGIAIGFDRWLTADEVEALAVVDSPAAIASHGGFYQSSRTEINHLVTEMANGCWDRTGSSANLFAPIQHGAVVLLAAQ